jgi:protein-tyrosine-phosphatase
MRALFVCRGNVCRSRVAENIFRVLAWSTGDNDVRSAGTKAGPGGRQIATRDVKWADVICVMEPEQEDYIRRRWPAHASKMRVLGIPDIYQPDDEALQDQLTNVVRTLLDESSERRTLGSASVSVMERRAKVTPSWWRGGAQTSWTAAGVAGVALLSAIGGYLASSLSTPERPVDSALTTSRPTLPIAPAATPRDGVPADRDAQSDLTGPSGQTIPGATDPIGPSRPKPAAMRVEPPPISSQSSSSRPTEALTIPLPPPPVMLPPEPSRVPAALPPPAPQTAVVVNGRSATASPADPRAAAPGAAATRPAPTDGGSRDGRPREDVDAADPGAIIDWVLREYPARRP